MKTCSYCGRDNPEEQTCCRECGAELIAPEKGLRLEFPPTAALPASPLVDLHALNAFSFEEGFSRPDWQLIRQTVEATVREEDWEQAWAEVALQWVAQLRDELGGNYHVTQSDDFILLCALDKHDTQGTLAFAGRALETIHAQLRDVAWTGFRGKHVILLFMDEDDYYQYQAPYLREGLNPASGGVMLGGGYVHMALPYQSWFVLRPSLAHELTHNCLAHLPLPLWLNEGVAVRLERFIAPSNQPMLHRELAGQHRNYWTEATIQQFWAGMSFQQPGEVQTLSYSLAEILVHMLAEEQEGFLGFVRHGHYDDAGQTAALDCLGVSLGDAAATFLGPGNWRPYRKAIVECWDHPPEPEEPPSPPASIF